MLKCSCSSSPVAAQYGKVLFRVRLLKHYKILNLERGFKMWRWISETEVHVSLGWRWIRTVKLQLKVTLWAEIHIWVKIICSSDNAFRSWQLPNTCYPEDSQACRHTMCCLYLLTQRSPWPSSPPWAELSWAWSAGNVVFSLAAALFTERIPRHNEEMLEINQSHCQHRGKFNSESSERFLVVSIYKHVVRELHEN